MSTCDYPILNFFARIPSKEGGRGEVLLFLYTNAVKYIYYSVDCQLLTCVVLGQRAQYVTIYNYKTPIEPFIGPTSPMNITIIVKIEKFKIKQKIKQTKNVQVYTWTLCCNLITRAICPCKYKYLYARACARARACVRVYLIFLDKINYR